MKRSAEAIWVEARNRWQINVQKDGKRKTFTSTLPGRKGKHEAELKADEWLESQTEDRRFGEAWEAYVADYKRRVKTETQLSRDSLYRHWIQPYIRKSMKLAQITPATWQKCIDAAADAGRSRNTISSIRGVISSFCHFCKRNRWKIEVPEAWEIIIPPAKPKVERHPLGVADLKRIFEVDTVVKYNWVRQCFYIYAWRLMILTGLRRGELAGLQWEDLEDGSVLHVRRAINRLGEITDGKTENAQRYVALSHRAVKAIDDQRAMLKREGIISPWMFPAKDAGYSDTNVIYRAWKFYQKQNGINCNLHELRHTFISAVKPALPMALLKQQVGHSDDMDTLGVYGHRMDGDLAATAATIDQVFDALIGEN